MAKEATLVRRNAIEEVVDPIATNVLPLFPLQLQSFGKRLTSFFYFLLGWIAGDSSRRTFRTGQER